MRLLSPAAQVPVRRILFLGVAVAITDGVGFVRLRVAYRPYNYCGRTCGARATAAGNQVVKPTIVVCKVWLHHDLFVGTISQVCPLAMQPKARVSESPVLRKEMCRRLDGRAWPDQYWILEYVVAFALESESSDTGRWSTGAASRE